MNRPTRASLALFAVIAACACASGQPAAPPHPSTSDKPSSDKPSDVAALEPAEEEVPAPAEASCGGKPCVPPEQCIRYVGFAGPSVPLYTCGQPCGDQGECPSDLSCATIADGPRLCR